MQETENKTVFTTESPEETKKLAGRFFQDLEPPSILCLIGPLGSGKTTFVKGFIDEAGGNDRGVRSPTFSLMQKYRETEPQIVHADLYRTDSARSQRTIGLEEYFGRGFLIVEWAEKWELSWPDYSKKIYFTHLSDKKRKVTLNQQLPEKTSSFSSDTS